MSTTTTPTSIEINKAIVTTTTTTTTKPSETSFLHEFTAGNIGGIASVLAAQPADTIKVRLQTAPNGTYSGTVDCFKQTIAKEGPFSLYKGILPPLFGVGLINACLFAANGTAKNFLLDKRTRESGEYQTELTLSDVAWAGAFAGLAQSAVAGPIELLKTRLQIDRSPSGAAQSVSQLVRTLNQKVGAKWLGMGMDATILREIFGYAGYFALYECLKRQLTHNNNGGSGASDSTQGIMSDSVASLFAGGSAGVAYWSISLPMDVVKSRLQAQSVDNGSFKYANSMECVRELAREGGVRAFYKGYSASIIRTIPSSAVCFFVYEQVIKLLK